MAPSRGPALLQQVLRTSTAAHGDVAYVRRAYSSFSEQLRNPANKLQSYVSNSRDPYLNLSIEDHILRASPPDSTVLFLYTNRPCVVIGRNQNPFTEVNLAMLNATTRGRTATHRDTEPPAIGNVELVRRRSGGGTVFHDEGNVNWSIVCPRASFTRDKHAELVVRALRKLGIDRARVNERHDIVLDQGGRTSDANPHDTHRTAYTIDNDSSPRPLKVSGSAYKLTRGRALHHGTTLLASPNLHIIPQYLHSPAKAYIEAKGVDSVSSPVANIGLDSDVFQKCLQEEFAAMYAILGTRTRVETVDENLLSVPEIKQGLEELRTKDWIISQTPQFTLRLGPAENVIMKMTVHHGIVKSLDLDPSKLSRTAIDLVQSALVETKIQDVDDWRSFLDGRIPKKNDDIQTIAGYLEKYLPIPDLPQR